MNSRPKIQTYLLIAAVVAVLIGSAFAPDYPDEDRASAFIDAGAVLALRPIILKEPANSQDFEKYAAEVYAPTWEKYAPGFRSYILKADRGQEKGEYILLYVFDSQETRNFYFPQEEGGFSELAQEMVRDYPDVNLDAYVDTTALSTFTDYVVLE